MIDIYAVATQTTYKWEKIIGDNYGVSIQESY